MENNVNQSKYEAALSLYKTSLNDAEINQKVADLIAEKVEANNTVEVKKQLFNCIDLTTLSTSDSDQSVMKFVQKVNDFDDKYPDLKNVAAICVYPRFAEVVKDTLDVENVNIACVSAGFPSSQTFIEVKVAETAMAVMGGANEIDIVISVGEFLSGNYADVCDEIEEIKETCKDAHLKVILETGALLNASNIKKASILAMYSGADFIKTSTGKQNPAATPEAVYVMCQAIKEYHEKTGRKI
jgi:deoxyribose-phosphate aldolase